MKRVYIGAALGLPFILCLVACGEKSKADEAAMAPPPVKIEHAGDTGTVQVDKPDQFPLVAVIKGKSAPELNVTGVVSPDITRTVPVISLASGRVIDLRVHLGDQVRKGQVLMRIQSADVSSAFSDYQKAQADAALANAQFERAQLLYSRGAVAQKDLEIAQSATQKAKVDVTTMAERIRLLGSNPDRIATTVDIVAPASGTIIEQNVNPSAAVKTVDNSPNLFTIADLSRVWVLCDVYENSLPSVRVGETADIRLNSYPDRVFQGRISNISSVLDPNTRTAKVRLELVNSGLMRVGMFVTATFHGSTNRETETVPATAVLHLHDRDWVFVAISPGKFRRTEVVSGASLPDNMQEIISGLSSGQQVAANALQLFNTLEQ